MKEEGNHIHLLGVLSSIVLFLINVGPALFFNIVLNKEIDLTLSTVGVISARVIGFFLSTCFNLILLIKDYFNKDFKIMCRRIIELFENLAINVKLAIKVYFRNLRENGCYFIIQFSMVIVSFILFILAAKELFTMYPI